MEIVILAGAETELFEAWTRYEELMPVRRFTHGIFYRVHGGRLVVTAVLDLRQNPSAILRRLEF